MSFAGAHDDSKQLSLPVNSGNTLRLLGGSSTLSVAQGCISSNGGVCVLALVYHFVFLRNEAIYLDFFQILTVSTDQRCSQRHQQILMEV